MDGCLDCDASGRGGARGATTGGTSQWRGGCGSSVPVPAQGGHRQQATYPSAPGREGAGRGSAAWGGAGRAGGAARRCAGWRLKWVRHALPPIDCADWVGVGGGGLATRSGVGLAGVVVLCTMTQSPSASTSVLSRESPRVLHSTSSLSPDPTSAPCLARRQLTSDTFRSHVSQDLLIQESAQQDEP